MRPKVTTAFQGLAKAPESSWTAHLRFIECTTHCPTLKIQVKIGCFGLHQRLVEDLSWKFQLRFNSLGTLCAMLPEVENEPSTVQWLFLLRLNRPYAKFQLFVCVHLHLLQLTYCVQ